MSTNAPPAAEADAVRHRLDRALADHLAALRAELAPYGPAAEGMVRAVARMLEGGKRLRPAFAYWTWRAVGDPTAGAGAGAGAAASAPEDVVLRVGAALELFQAAALLHDDVMDASDTRRGRPSAHRTYEAMHREHRWDGPAARFGENAAILLGDLALVASEREFAAATAELGARLVAPVRDVFDLMRTEVTVGQFLDVLTQAGPWGADPAADEARARDVIRAKSARYSVEHPMVLGALLAGGGRDDVARARRAGAALGEAFQLRDDLLGVFGDPSRTGKPAGDDLREGKRTVLVARTVAVADEHDRSTLLGSLGDRTMDAGTVEALRSCIVRSGAVDAVEDLIAGLAADARRELGASGWAAEPLAVLGSLADAAVDRVA